VPTVAVLIVIALRLIVPLSILRWPLAGGLISMVLDGADVILVDALGRALGEPTEFGPIYAQLDKLLDTWYLTLELIVTRRWHEEMLRRTALILYVWRLIGAVAFELTDIHPLLVVFPNLFENFYLYVLIMWRLAPRLVPRSLRELLLVLVVLYIPKAIQEWLLHWEEAHPWEWLRDTVIRPILGGS
jgi:hypothetical protein